MNELRVFIARMFIGVLFQYVADVYENVDFITSNIMLPMSAVFITIFAAWVMSKNSSSEELDGHGVVYKIWQLLARYFAPIAILVIFLQAIGWI